VSFDVRGLDALVMANASGVTSTSVNDSDLTGELAATTSDTSSATAISYQLTDPQGNVLGTANPADPYEVVTPIVTDEFGNVQTISGAPTSGPRYGWLGGSQRDASSLGGIILMGARGYAPALGRFLSVDSDTGASANPYDYSDQDPVNESDLAGTSPNEDQAWAFFTEFAGFSTTIAAAIIGNLVVESGSTSLPTHANNHDGNHGIAQWGTTVKEGKRWQKLIAYAKRLNQSRWNITTQLEFILHNLETGYADALAAMKADGTDLSAATIDFQDIYEGAEG
jgi:RHS repeat-associated protein